MTDFACPCGREYRITAASVPPTPQPERALHRPTFGIFGLGPDPNHYDAVLDMARACGINTIQVQGETAPRVLRAIEDGRLPADTQIIQELHTNHGRPWEWYRDRLELVRTRPANFPAIALDTELKPLAVDDALARLVRGYAADHGIPVFSGQARWDGYLIATWRKWSGHIAWRSVSHPTRMGEDANWFMGLQRAAHDVFLASPQLVNSGTNALADEKEVGRALHIMAMRGAPGFLLWGFDRLAWAMDRTAAQPMLDLIEHMVPCWGRPWHEHYAGSKTMLPVIGGRTAADTRGTEHYAVAAGRILHHARIAAEIVTDPDEADITHLGQLLPDEWLVTTNDPMNYIHHLNRFNDGGKTPRDAMREKEEAIGAALREANGELQER